MDTFLEGNIVHLRASIVNNDLNPLRGRIAKQLLG
jgi:hypothetical protein